MILILKVFEIVGDILFKELRYTNHAFEEFSSWMFVNIVIVTKIGLFLYMFTKSIALIVTSFYLL